MICCRILWDTQADEVVACTTVPRVVKWIIWDDCLRGQIIVDYYYNQEYCRNSAFLYRSDVAGICIVVRAQDPGTVVSCCIWQVSSNKSWQVVGDEKHRTSDDGKKMKPDSRSW